MNFPKGIENCATLIDQVREEIATFDEQNNQWILKTKGIHSGQFVGGYVWMNIAELFKKNFIFIPIVISIVVGGFTSIKYVLNLTTTINESETQIVNLQRDLSVAQKRIN